MPQTPGQMDAAPTDLTAGTGPFVNGYEQGADGRWYFQGAGGSASNAVVSDPYSSGGGLFGLPPMPPMITAIYNAVADPVKQFAQAVVKAVTTPSKLTLGDAVSVVAPIGGSVLVSDINHPTDLIGQAVIVGGAAAALAPAAPVASSLGSDAAAQAAVAPSTLSGLGVSAPADLVASDFGSAAAAQAVVTAPTAASLGLSDLTTSGLIAADFGASGALSPVAAAHQAGGGYAVPTDASAPVDLVTPNDFSVATTPPAAPVDPVAAALDGTPVTPTYSGLAPLSPDLTGAAANVAPGLGDQLLAAIPNVTLAGISGAAGLAAKGAQLLGLGPKPAAKAAAAPAPAAPATSPLIAAAALIIPGGLVALLAWKLYKRGRK